MHPSNNIPDSNQGAAPGAGKEPGAHAARRQGERLEERREGERRDEHNDACDPDFARGEDRRG